MSELHIPKIMHHIWIGQPMPAHLSANCQQWLHFHPDWEFNLWTEHEIDGLALQNRALYDQAAGLVPPDAIEQFRADIVRYEVLSIYGGVYTDVDTRPLRNIEPALDGHKEFAAREDRNWVGNTYLAAVPDHPIMQDIIAGMPANVHRQRGKRPNKLSGPQYITPIWNRHHGHVAPRDQWYPFSYIDVKRGSVPDQVADNVYAIHGWDHTRRVMDARNGRR